MRQQCPSPAPYRASQCRIRPHLLRSPLEGVSADAAQLLTCAFT
jgi:hypothetical protein